MAVATERVLSFVMDVGIQEVVLDRDFLTTVNALKVDASSSSQESNYINLEDGQSTTHGKKETQYVDEK